MSKCISRHGEYSEHEPLGVDHPIYGDQPLGRFVCSRCWALDEDAAGAALDAAEAERDRLRSAWDAHNTDCSAAEADAAKLRELVGAMTKALARAQKVAEHLYVVSESSRFDHGRNNADVLAAFAADLCAALAGER